MSDMIFKLERPSGKEIGIWPVWNYLLDSFIGSDFDLKPEFIWYSKISRRYAIIVEYVPNTKIIVDTKWLKKDKLNDKHLICLRPSKPFKWACVRHFLKKERASWSVVKCIETGSPIRIAAIADNRLIDTISKLGIAHIHMIGEEWPKWMILPKNLRNSV